MDQLRLRIPGKCFLVGEYLALNGGPALVFTNKPMFEFLAVLEDIDVSEINETAASKEEARRPTTRRPHKSDDEGNKGLINFGHIYNPKKNEKNPFHPFSPAGRFFLAHEATFSRYHLAWKDPYFDSYFSKGGWGASSAQFLALHFLFQMQDQLWIEGENIADLHLMLDDYRFFGRPKGTEKGLPPSGADLMAQAKGGLCYFDRLNGKFQKFSWPFLDIGLAVIPTGKKVPTHEHLQELNSIQTESFEGPVKKVYESLRTVNSLTFVEGLSEFSEQLRQKALIFDFTSEVLAALKKCGGVLAAKGCGALGADMVLLVYQKESGVLQNIERFLEQMDLRISCTEMDISDGLEIRYGER